MSRETCIPYELIIEILSRLPPKSLIRFRCVCKSWCALIHDRWFQDHHYSNHSKNAIAHWVSTQAPSLDNDSPLKYHVFDETFSSLQCAFDEEHLGGSWFSNNLVGSCKGLICVRHLVKYNEPPPYNNLKMSLWNPSTRSHKKVELVDLMTSNLVSDPMLGFGFSSKDNDHKVVIIYYKDWQDGQAKVHVHSVTNNSCSKIQSKPTLWRWTSDYGTYLNGVCYWICGNDYHSNSGWILCFNFNDNKFRNIDLPSDYCSTWCKMTFVYKDMLALWTLCFHQFGGIPVAKKEHTIWIKKDDDCSKSWTCLLKLTINEYDKIPRFDAARVFGSTRDGGLLYTGCDDKPSLLMAYDLETRQIEELVQGKIIAQVAYEQSLYLL